MPVLWGVASVAFLIAGHDQTQLNRVCSFLFFGVFLASGGSNFQEFVSLIISIPLQRMPTYVDMRGLRRCIVTGPLWTVHIQNKKKTH